MHRQTRGRRDQSEFTNQVSELGEEDDVRRIGKTFNI